LTVVNVRHARVLRRTRGSTVITHRDRSIADIDALIGHLTARGLAEQTSSLLESSLTLQQFRVLVNVYLRGPVAIHDVADTLGIKPNVATGVVQRLVERDLVERHEDPGDRRARLLRTNERGSGLIEELGTVVQAQRRKLLERLSDPQLSQLRDILEVMAS